MKKTPCPLFPSVQPRWGHRHADTPIPQLAAAATLLTLAAVLVTGCQVLTYHSPTGERFTRSSLGAKTAINSLVVQSDTNGLRRVELKGYQNDSVQALGVVTEAAIRAAVQSAK